MSKIILFETVAREIKKAGLTKLPSAERWKAELDSLVSSGKIQEASVNILEDVVATLLGDPISAGKLLLAIAQSPFSIREQLFWSKMEAFLNGAYLSKEDCAKLCAKLTENGAKKDNPFKAQNRKKPDISRIFLLR